MRIRRTRDCWGLLLLCLLMSGGSVGRAEETTPQQAAVVLSSICLKCHNGQTKAGGIELSSRGSAGKAGVLGTGVPAQSRLVQAVSTGKMPPTGKLPDAQIALLRRWMMEGAIYPQATLTFTPPAIKPLWSLHPVTH